MDIKVEFAGNKKVYAKINDFVIETDQPEFAGGDNSAPAPFELFMASIATCAGIYVKMFCDNRKLPTENIEITQNAEYNNETGLPTKISINIKLPSDFPEKYKDAVIKVAEKCKVKQTIASKPNFEIVLK